MSFKNKITAAILTAVIAVTAQSCTPTPGGDPLMWLTFPLTIEGRITENSGEYKVKANFDTPSHGIIEIDTHRYLCDNGTVTLDTNGLLLPIKTVPPTVKFITAILSLTAETLTSTESDGKQVKAVYQTEYTITTDPEGNLTKAETPTISLTITN